MQSFYSPLMTHILFLQNLTHRQVPEPDMGTADYNSCVIGPFGNVFLVIPISIFKKRIEIPHRILTPLPFDVWMGFNLQLHSWYLILQLTYCPFCNQYALLRGVGMMVSFIKASHFLNQFTLFFIPKDTLLKVLLK